MDKEELRDLMREFYDSPLSYLAIDDGETRIKMKKPVPGDHPAPAPVFAMPPFPGMPAGAPQPAAAPAAPAQAAEPPASDDVIRVKAPLVGVYYAAPSPEDEPYVKVGDHVEKDDVICLIEAMKMINEIKAPKAGTVRWIAVENAATVGFGDLLMEISAD